MWLNITLNSEKHWGFFKQHTVYIKYQIYQPSPVEEVML